MNLKDISYYAMISSALIIIILAFLKSIGIINTPNWITLLPYFAGGVSVLGITYHLGKIMNGIERLLLIE